MLHVSGLRATELAEELNVHRRTVYRDLDFLSAQGVPIWQQEGTYGINRTRYLATIRLTFQEAVGLVLAGLLFARTLDERNPHVISALRRLAVTLPEPLTETLERAAARVQNHKPDPCHVAVLETLAEGWASGRKVRISYRPPRGDRSWDRVICPYMLEPTPAGIYVIAHDDRAGGIRTYKLERLQGAELRQQRYSIPVSFDPLEFLADSWGIMTSDRLQEVVLRFDARVASYVTERVWHSSQVLAHDEKGGVTLHLRVAAPQEMLPWIRSWGSSVEVLGPRWLRSQVGEDLKKAAAQYAAESGK